MPPRQKPQANSRATKAKLSSEDKLALERHQILHAAAGGDLDTLTQRVAWVLNNYPETRDSDIKLQLGYWTHFEGYTGGIIEPRELFDRTRLTSIARSRARIQNTHNLFLASPDVRKARGTLSEEERQKAVEQQPSFPVFAVYADESGKGAPNLIVASVWFLHAPDTLQLLNRITRWRNDQRFQGEFHFKTIDKDMLPFYQGFIATVVEQAASISFKAISVSTKGIGRQDSALDDLYYFLLLRGIQHEIASGRGLLPRSIQVWKDLEERGRDELLLAKLADALQQAGKTVFDGGLTTDVFEAVSSDALALIQIADLFAGSLNRIMNRTGEKRGPKDEFAEYLLNRVGMPKGPSAPERTKDMMVLLQL